MRTTTTRPTHVPSILLCLGLLLPAAACSDRPSGGDGRAGAAGEQAAHVPHFAWVSDEVARGGQPRGEAAFRELSRKGIRCIISVDGARPDIETAERFGMRTVHIPFGYDGVPEEQQLALVKTVRELEGPFFVHCHHGKHRGPAGAVIAQMALGGMTNQEAVAELRRAGTAEKYAGLYGTATVFRVPSDEEVGSFRFEFPSVAPVPELAAAMALVDRRFDHLKIARKAGWGVAEEHPDLDPPHEALQLLELFTELGRLDGAKARPADFRELLDRATRASRELEAALRASPPDVGAAEEAFRGLSRSCTQCHTPYRNSPGR